MLFSGFFINKKKNEINEFDVFDEINIYIFILIKMFKDYRFKFEKTYKKNKK